MMRLESQEPKDLFSYGPTATFIPTSLRVGTQLNAINIYLYICYFNHFKHMLHDIRPTRNDNLDTAMESFDTESFFFFSWYAFGNGAGTW